eukprot:m.9509 g.9509  ORF g.9509 m.9509 type:complete len:174 (+) comp21394_c0_seq4:276-797(+)
MKHETDRFDSDYIVLDLEELYAREELAPSPTPVRKHWQGPMALFKPGAEVVLPNGLKVPIRVLTREDLEASEAATNAKIKRPLQRWLKTYKILKIQQCQVSQRATLTLGLPESANLKDAVSPWELTVPSVQPLFRVAPQEGWCAANAEEARSFLDFPHCSELKVDDKLLLGYY